MPGWEAVRLECTDGETFQSRKFKTVQFVLIGYNKSTIGSSQSNWTSSGQTITIQLKGADTTDVPITLFIKGDR